ncbi:acyl carrier protein [Schizopora paradoxa]|uniref:Acyl carrier protein n=1 Tax=Schizopora paradoxa TaxID=27342 RepID=A0A0H2S9U0_9AGAM|nr:acyl carrier protein [Schizopora paradoxa]
MSFLRAALQTSLRSSRVLATPRISYSLRPQAISFQRATFASQPALTKDDIQSRVLDVLKSFEKVDASKLSPSASFAGDLGLDSLDAVEVVMAVEEEFAIEIPDAEADEIQTVQQAIDYIAKTPAAPRRLLKVAFRLSRLLI